jgi:hypothetical protein
MKSILSTIWRTSGSVVAGAALATFLASPWGLILTPALAGISKTIKKSYEVGGKSAPSWVAWLPF